MLTLASLLSDAGLASARRQQGGVQHVLGPAPARLPGPGAVSLDPRSLLMTPCTSEVGDVPACPATAMRLVYLGNHNARCCFLRFCLREARNLPPPPVPLRPRRAAQRPAPRATTGRHDHAAYHRRMLHWYPGERMTGFLPVQSAGGTGSKISSGIWWPSETIPR